LLQEFPFVDEASRAVAVSALITPVVRGAVPVAPLHGTTAPVAGSGKSYIIDLASAISTGERAPVMAAGRNEEETEKRLAAALLNGQSIISIDNVNGDLGGDLLCQMIERPIVSIRPLGSSKLAKIESRATVYATGNNIHMVGDMTRRVVICSLDPNVERPELREFKVRPFDMVIVNRGRYIAAALVIVRAYAVAGYPAMCHPLASFEDWSRVVRSALVWLGMTDPVETMKAARDDDPDTSALRALLCAWRDAIGTKAHSAAQVIARADERNPYGERTYPDLHQALLEVADDGRGNASARRLGKYLTRHKGRILTGLKFASSEDLHAKLKVWSVAEVTK
jgi:putative DNA primase/helicase